MEEVQAGKGQKLHPGAAVNTDTLPGGIATRHFLLPFGRGWVILEESRKKTKGW